MQRWCFWSKVFFQAYNAQLTDQTMLASMQSNITHHKRLHFKLYMIGNLKLFKIWAHFICQVNNNILENILSYTMPKSVWFALEQTWLYLWYSHWKLKKSCLSLEVIKYNYILTGDLLVFVTYSTFCIMEAKTNWQQGVWNHVHVGYHNRSR